ncbi:MAG: NUDIX hydrolase [Saprospiraceae bacterium]|nr:NUDIX hydrolase [Saprospiraceae bacterium]
MFNEQENPWQTLNSSIVYDNRWIQVTHREVITPTGTSGVYGKVHFKNLAIGIVPLDADYNTWLVGQYRYVLEQYSWEIPEGGCPIGTAPLESAKRELLEETGIRAATWTKLLDVHTSNSVTDEFGHVFIAQDLQFGESMPEDTEQLMIKKLPLSDTFDLVMQNQITDSISVAALLKTFWWMKEGKI